MEPQKSRNSSLKRKKRGSNFNFKINPKKVNVKKSIFSTNKRFKSKDNGSLMVSKDSIDLKLVKNTSNDGNSISSFKNRKSPDFQIKKSRLSIMGQSERIKNDIKEQSKRRSS